MQIERMIKIHEAISAESYEIDDSNHHSFITYVLQIL